MVDRARQLQKARGVFYTPDALAAQMVGRALALAKGRFPHETLMVLDPACGDGAFLRQLPKGRTRGFGVDVDPVALARAARFGETRLGDAIIDDVAVSRDALRWYEAFPRVMGEGGFHVVVGNPPYRNVDAPMAGEDRRDHGRKKRWIQCFRSPDPKRLSWGDHYRRMCDLYHLFFIRALWALRPGGVLAFVTSRSFLEAWFADHLRALLATETTLVSLTDHGDEAHFAGTAVPTCVTILVKAKAPAGHRVSVRSPLGTAEVAQASLGRGPWHFFAGATPGAVRLGELCDLSQGMQTGSNRVFAAFKPDALAAFGPARRHFFRRVASGDLRAGQLQQTRPRFALWTEDLDEDALPPRIAAWLNKERRALEARAAVRRGNCEWFRWSWPRPGQFQEPKILCPYRARENRFWFDAAGEYVGLTDTTVLLPRPDCPVAPAALVARLNDAEHTRRWRARAKRTGGGLFEYFAASLAELPVSL